MSTGLIVTVYFLDTRSNKFVYILQTRACLHWEWNMVTSRMRILQLLQLLTSNLLDLKMQGKTHKQTDRQRDRQTDRWMDGWTDEQ